MSPITAKATHLSVLRYHVQQLTVLLSRLDQGLLLSGQTPESHPIRSHLVEAIRMSHSQIGTLMCTKSVVAAEMYADNRGLTP